MGGLSNAIAFVARVPVLSSLAVTFCVGKGGLRAKAGRIASKQSKQIAARVPETAEHRVPATEELIQSRNF